MVKIILVLCLLFVVIGLYACIVSGKKEDNMMYEYFNKMKDEENSEM